LRAIVGTSGVMVMVESSHSRCWGPRPDDATPPRRGSGLSGLAAATKEQRVLRNRAHE
jgi:hypothetical protein